MKACFKWIIINFIIFDIDNDYNECNDYILFKIMDKLYIIFTYLFVKIKTYFYKISDLKDWIFIYIFIHTNF